MIAERIKDLRERHGWTQADLAKNVRVTRSSVNSWESGIAVPSTAMIVQLAELFKVSSDYLLGCGNTATISVQGLSTRQVGMLVEIANEFRKK